MIDQFDYKITGVGWAEMTFVSHTGDKVVITISYCCEPLPGLLDALCRLQRDESRFEVIEMGGDNYDFTLVLCEVAAGILRIEVLEYAYFDVLDPDEDRVPIPLFTAYDRTCSICECVLGNLEDLVRNMGLEEYKEKWCTAFPVEKLTALKDAMRR